MTPRGPKPGDEHESPGGLPLPDHSILGKRRDAASTRRALPPEHLPSPTLWPPALALGITLTFWGLVSSFVIFGAGVAVMVCGLVGWINALRHEK